MLLAAQQQEVELGFGLPIIVGCVNSDLRMIVMMQFAIWLDCLFRNAINRMPNVSDSMNMNLKCLILSIQFLAQHLKNLQKLAL